MNERHSFILPGIISREAFQDVAVRATRDDDTLNWYLHAHPYAPYGDLKCNDRCQVVHKGIVATNVTQMDVADVPHGA